MERIVQGKDGVAEEEKECPPPPKKNIKLDAGKEESKQNETIYSWKSSRKSIECDTAMNMQKVKASTQ